MFPVAVQINLSKIASMDWCNSVSNILDTDFLHGTVSTGIYQLTLCSHVVLNILNQLDHGQTIHPISDPWFISSTLCKYTLKITHDDNPSSESTKETVIRIAFKCLHFVGRLHIMKLRGKLKDHHESELQKAPIQALLEIESIKRKLQPLNVSTLPKLFTIHLKNDDRVELSECTMLLLQEKSHFFSDMMDFGGLEFTSRTIAFNTESDQLNKKSFLLFLKAIKDSSLPISQMVNLGKKSSLNLFNLIAKSAPDYDTFVASADQTLYNYISSHRDCPFETILYLSHFMEQTTLQGEVYADRLKKTKLLLDRILVYFFHSTSAHEMENRFNLNSTAFRGIRNLDLSDLRFTNVVLEKFIEYCPHLTTVCIKDSDMQDSSLAEITKLKNLQTLYLINCRGLTSEGLKHLSDLKNITSLDLSGSWLTDDGLELVRVHTNLETLILNDCTGLTYSGLVHLRVFKSLKSLELKRWHNLTAEGLDNLRALSSLNRIIFEGITFHDPSITLLKVTPLS